jgi:hypothetical protein
MATTPSSIAQDFSDLAGHIGDILANPNVNVNLTDAQRANLEDDSVSLTGYAGQIIDQDALAVLNATQANLDQIKKATGDANATAARLKARANQLNTVLQILGDAVALGAAIAAGPLTGVLTAATTFAGDIPPGSS